MLVLSFTGDRHHLHRHGNCRLRRNKRRIKAIAVSTLMVRSNAVGGPFCQCGGSFSIHSCVRDALAACFEVLCDGPPTLPPPPATTRSQFAAFSCQKSRAYAGCRHRLTKRRSRHRRTETAGSFDFRRKQGPCRPGSTPKPQPAPQRVGKQVGQLAQRRVFPRPEQSSSHLDAEPICAIPSTKGFQYQKARRRDSRCSRCIRDLFSGENPQTSIGMLSPAVKVRIDRRQDKPEIGSLAQAVRSAGLMQRTEWLHLTG